MKINICDSIKNSKKKDDLEYANKIAEYVKKYLEDNFLNKELYLQRELSVKILTIDDFSKIQINIWDSHLYSKKEPSMFYVEVCSNLIFKRFRVVCNQDYEKHINYNLGLLKYSLDVLLKRHKQPPNKPPKNTIISTYKETGTRDINGNMIHENDKVKTSKGIFIVKFYNAAFALTHENGNHFEYMCNMSDMLGSIYEKIE